MEAERMAREDKWRSATYVVALIDLLVSILLLIYILLLLFFWIIFFWNISGTHISTWTFHGVNLLAIVCLTLVAMILIFLVHSWAAVRLLKSTEEDRASDQKLKMAVFWRNNQIALIVLQLMITVPIGFYMFVSLSSSEFWARFSNHVILSVVGICVRILFIWIVQNYIEELR
ncbi:unnamed protein product [Orchesella dallaii]|uniref:Uncharacterized protein n=1 Tax=Orchesella dallaii TaxID=48710 RepID=A0ABP1PQF6_9HEXA